MSKITNDSLTRSGNSGRQRVNAGRPCSGIGRRPSVQLFKYKE